MTDPSLKACVDWLTRCSLLPRDHWLASGKAQLPDLAHQLKDGVLLCHLLIRLHPAAIDPKEFSQRPQMSQFLCLKNSRAFIQSCKTVFRMKDEDLFEPQALFNSSEYGRILHTLSVLSKTQLAQRSGIKPFDTNEIYYMNMKTFDDYVTEDGLEEDDSSIEANDQDVENQDEGNIDESIYQNNDSDHDKSIYDDLCSLQRCLIMQQDTQPKTKRDMCIQELVETEKKYVDVLHSIQMEFMRPLKKAGNLLSQKDFETIFFGIDKLYNAHMEFKGNLLRACENNSMLSIPDCFVTCKEKFLFYGEYCANLTLAQETVDKLCLNNPNLQAKVKELEFAANEGRFRMRDMLSIPMQRVLKYHLLLKELIKHTTEDHQERKMLEKALDETQDLSLFVNEVKRDREMLSSISLVSNSIVDLPKSCKLPEFGRLLMDGAMKIKMATETGVQHRHIFLFDKVMLICKAMKNESYHLKNTLVLTYYDVTFGKEKGQCCVSLREKSGKDWYTILSKKEEPIQKWHEVIRLALDNQTPEYAHNAKHSFEMFTFEKPTICDVCRKLLRGVFFQGYKCTKTQMNVHKECLRTAKDMDGPPTGRLPNRQSRKCSQDPGSSAGKSMRTVARYNGLPSPGYGRASLSFDVGEMVEVLSDKDPEWMEGEVRGRRGFFPRTAVWDPKSRVNSHEPTSPQSVVPPSRCPSNYQNKDALEELELIQFPWYAGVLSRDLAIQKLNPLSNGSYLIRLRDGTSEYAISIKFDEKVMHMKVSRDEDGKYFLGASKKFDSIPFLVDYYQQIPLERIYAELKTVLATPFKNARRPGRRVLGQCVARFDYSATEPSQLSLRKDEVVTIISKADENTGWWKGELRSGKVGLFPVTYVREIETPGP